MSKSLYYNFILKLFIQIKTFVFSLNHSKCVPIFSIMAGSYFEYNLWWKSVTADRYGYVTVNTPNKKNKKNCPPDGQMHPRWPKMRKMHDMDPKNVSTKFHSKIPSTFFYFDFSNFLGGGEIWWCFFRWVWPSRSKSWHQKIFKKIRGEAQPI